MVVEARLACAQTMAHCIPVGLLVMGAVALPQLQDCFRHYDDTCCRIHCGQVARKVLSSLLSSMRLLTSSYRRKLASVGCRMHMQG